MNIQQTLPLKVFIYLESREVESEDRKMWTLSLPNSLQGKKASQ